eukprot:SAG31_NODE_5270_length_2640_cov_1.554900_3_plen_51_part_00
MRLLAASKVEQDRLGREASEAQLAAIASRMQLAEARRAELSTASITSIPS